MKALVLERVGELAIRDIDLPQIVGPNDVRIAIDTVGVCGSDVHYYTHGRIGDFVVKEPMVLGHEGAGRIVEVGAAVTHLKVGDRVCMEPGIPDQTSRASKLGIYNVDPAVTFWATPPDHGILTSHVVHPAAFTYRLPEEVSFAEGAMVEPFAIGMQAAARAKIAPGDVAVVTGSGTIGIMIALAALAGGCSKVLITDVSAEKLDIAGQYDGIIPINVSEGSLQDAVERHTSGWGADVVFEASGAPSVLNDAVRAARPGGCLVLVGMPQNEIPFDVNAAIAREVRIETVFRYANVFDRALELIASGKVDLKPLISETFSFEESISAFERAAKGLPTDIKLQIKIADHEFIVFLGPSGCGKSTMLRMMAGLEEISGGDLKIGGKVVNDLEPRDRGIAMVFQNYALYPHMTIRDNIAFGLRRIKVPEPEIKARTQEVTSVLGLEPYLDRKPTELSGGQQQRVAIARAMIKTPDVFLFDEPLSNLDAKLRATMREEIARLHKKLRTTTVYVTHDQMEAMTLADRIVLMKDGRIEQVGSPEEIYERPVSKFVAGFIGTPAMNFIDLKVEQSGDQWLLVGDEVRLAFDAERFNIQNGEDVTLGVRPSDLEPAKKSNDRTLAGDCDLIEYHGDQALVSFEVAGKQLHALVPARHRPNEDEAVCFEIRKGASHLFDRKTGNSLLRTAELSG
ncbi:putative D-xylulose reductase [Nymphon striatum]|nr:putative D-xylulose reductase [Nymphon striatum]